MDDNKLTTEFTNDFSKEIFEQTYKFGDQDINQTFERIAKSVASIESDPEYWETQFKKILNNFAFLPGGRIISNAGTPYDGTTLINCFVSGMRGDDQDSMVSISNELARQALILKSEGGYGFNVDVLRPRGAYVRGIGNESPGVVEMLEMWDTQSKVITAGSGKKAENKLAKKKIRKGAMMVTLSCSHPDVEEFITAKQRPNYLTKFNMSVLISDEFMRCVKEHKPWKLIFPAYDDTRKEIRDLWKKIDIGDKTIKDIYSAEWDGDITKWVNKNYPIEVYKEYEDANELWDLLMRSTYNRNEPGVLFIDTINQLNNLYYIEHINATNPCVIGETLVLTNYGWLRIDRLHNERNLYPGIKIITLNKEKKLELSELTDVMLTEKNAELYATFFENGERLITNGKHKIYRSNFEEISIFELYNQFNLINNNIALYHPQTNKNIIRQELGSFITGKDNLHIDNIIKLDYREDVYDLTAIPNYNFFSSLSANERILDKPYGLPALFNNFLVNFFFEGAILNKDCGEQTLPADGACLLSSLNLTQFIKDGGWDFDKLSEYIPIAIRFMDNINDITYVPLSEQKFELVNKRRIGLGITGYASALLLLGHKYGSEEALHQTNQLMDFIANKAYQSSALLAAEKGAFSLFDKEKYLQSNFIKRLAPETQSMIEQYGIRNSHLISVQPTGNSSCLANNISSGIEPIFASEYKRTFIIPYPPSGLNIPKNIDWKKFEIKDKYLANNWEWKSVGDEKILSIKYNGVIYNIDQNRGLTKESLIMDYAVDILQRDNIDYSSWYIDIDKLKVDDHINTMDIFSKYADAAVSKTLTFPAEYQYDEFKEAYIKAHSTGNIKGCTTYRVGTMASVISTITENDSRNGNKIHKNSAPKRPKHLECDIHRLVSMGTEWMVLVGMLGDDPYEIFAFKKSKIYIPPRFDKGNIIKIKSGEYNLEIDNGLLIENITELFEQEEYEALTRMISTSLRHGVDIKFVVDQLNKSEGTVASFSKAMARTLKKYIKEPIELRESECPNCGEPDGLMNIEGCIKCKYCNFSVC